MKSSACFLPLLRMLWSPRSSVESLSRTRRTRFLTLRFARRFPTLYLSDPPIIAGMYNGTVLDHYNNPRNLGEIEGADGVGIYMSDYCGDITKFWIRVSGGRITEATYRTQGCAAAVACGSVLTGLVRGRTVEEALRMTKDDIVSALNGLPERKIHCSVLADDSMKDAVRDYLTRNDLPVPRELVEKHERITPLIEEMRERGYVLI